MRICTSKCFVLLCDANMRSSEAQKKILKLSQNSNTIISTLTSRIYQLYFYLNHILQANDSQHQAKLLRHPSSSQQEQLAGCYSRLMTSGYRKKNVKHTSVYPVFCDIHSVELGSLGLTWLPVVCSQPPKGNKADLFGSGSPNVQTHFLQVRTRFASCPRCT